MGVSKGVWPIGSGSIFGELCILCYLMADLDRECLDTVTQNNTTVTLKFTDRSLHALSVFPQNDASWDFSRGL